MEIKQGRCTSCGAPLDLSKNKRIITCQYCQNTVVVEQAKALGQLEIDKSLDIARLRKNLHTAVLHNSIDEIQRLSALLLDIMPNDYIANYFFAYAKQVQNQPRFMYDFLNEEKAYSQDDFLKVVEHIINYSELRDKGRIISYIKKTEPSYLDNYITAFNKRVELEENYAIVPRDVFVCFSSQDQDCVKETVNQLEDDGNSCWVSYRNLRPDDTENYWYNIETAIKNASVVLVVSSESAMRSKDVQHEIALAKEHQKPLIEFKIDATERSTYFKHAFDRKRQVVFNSKYKPLLQTVYQELYTIKHSKVKTSKKLVSTIGFKLGMFTLLILFGFLGFKLFDFSSDPSGVVDQRNPDLELISEAVIYVPLNHEYGDPGIRVHDASDYTIDINNQVDTSNEGVYEVVFTVIDKYDNESTITRVVHVVDADFPLIVLNGESDMTISVDDDYVETGAKIYFQDGTVDEISMISDFDEASLINEITYSYQEGDNYYTATRTVHQIDEIPPVILLIGDENVVVPVGNDYEELGAVVNDNHDYGLDLEIVSDDIDTSVPGIYEVTYNASDHSGNEAIEVTRIVSVELAKPEVSTDFFASRHTIDFTVTISDSDGVFETAALIIKDGNGETVRSQSIALGSYDYQLTNLNAGEEYTLELRGNYTLGGLSGRLTDDLFYEETFKTIAYKEPEFKNYKTEPSFDAVHLNTEIYDPDDLLNIVSTTLMYGDEIIETHSGLHDDFEGLEYLTSYKVEVVYQYDLMDGQGMQTHARSSSFTTTPYVTVLDIEYDALNYTVGDTMQLDITLDNPIMMDLSYISINNSRYQIINQSLNQITVDVDVTSEFVNEDNMITINSVKGHFNDEMVEIYVNERFIISSNIYQPPTLLEINILNESYDETDYIVDGEVIIYELKLNNPTNLAIDSVSAYLHEDDQMISFDDEQVSLSEDFQSLYVTINQPSGYFEPIGIDYINYDATIHSISLSRIFHVSPILDSNELIEITTAHELLNMAQGNGYVLMNDIDFTDFEETYQFPTLSNVYLDGNNYTLRNFSYTNMSYDINDHSVGLFTQILSSTIINLNIDNTHFNVQITDEGNYEDTMGTHAGLLSSDIINTVLKNITVTNSSIELTNTVDEYIYVGGLVGSVSRSMVDSVALDIDLSYDNSSQEKSVNVGGMFGAINDSIVEQSSITGTMSGEINEGTIGGFVGRDYNSVIIDSYSGVDMSFEYAKRYMAGFAGYAIEVIYRNLYVEQTIDSDSLTNYGIVADLRNSNVYSVFSFSVTQEGTYVSAIGINRDSEISNYYTDNESIDLVYIMTTLFDHTIWDFQTTINPPVLRTSNDGV